MAQNYFRELSAPLKGFYKFKNSAHSPMFEEPDLAGEILRIDVLRCDTSLADLS